MSLTKCMYMYISLAVSLDNACAYRFSGFDVAAETGVGDDGGFLRWTRPPGILMRG